MFWKHGVAALQWSLTESMLNSAEVNLASKLLTVLGGGVRHMSMLHATSLSQWSVINTSLIVTPLHKQDGSC